MEPKPLGGTSTHKYLILMVEPLTGGADGPVDAVGVQHDALPIVLRAAARGRLPVNLHRPVLLGLVREDLLLQGLERCLLVHGGGCREAGYLETGGAKWWGLQGGGVPADRGGAVVGAAGRWGAWGQRGQSGGGCREAGCLETVVGTSKLRCSGSEPQFTPRVPAHHTEKLRQCVPCTSAFIDGVGTRLQCFLFDISVKL